MPEPVPQPGKVPPVSSPLPKPAPAVIQPAGSKYTLDSSELDTPTRGAPVSSGAPKGFWGNVGESAGELASAGGSLIGFGGDTLTVGRGLWDGSKALVNQLPDNYADQGVTKEWQDFRGTYQDAPIGYREYDPQGNQTGTSYATMRQAQSTDDTARTALKSLPFVGAVPSFSDAGKQLYHGDILNAAGNTLGGVLALSGAGSAAKGMGQMAARSAGRGGMSEASALAIREAAAATASRPLTLKNALGHVMSTPTSPLSGGLGAAGRMTTRAAPTWGKYLPTVGKGFKEIPMSAVDAAKEIGLRASQGSAAFKSTIGALSSGNLRNAGKSLLESGRHFGSIPSNLTAAAEHVGGATQSALLNPFINLAPTAGSRAAASGFANNWLQSAGMFGQMATTAPILASKAKELTTGEGFNPDSTMGGITDFAANNRVMDWANRGYSAFSAVGSPTSSLGPTQGLKPYLSTLALGYDFDAAKREQEMAAYKQAPHWDSMLGSGKGMQYQSAHPVNPYQGLAANANSAFRHPFSTANTQYPTQAMISKYLNEQGLKWSDLSEEQRVNLWQRANNFAKQDFNDQNYRTDPANYK